jgi:hypothetical protein
MPLIQSTDARARPRNIAHGTRGFTAIQYTSEKLCLTLSCECQWAARSVGTGQSQSEVRLADSSSFYCISERPVLASEIDW